MTGLVRKATLLTVCGLIAAGAAFANVPSRDQSDCPSGWIFVVGGDGAQGDPTYTFCITVRDLSGNPIPNSSVIIDWSNCTDLSLCEDQLDPDVTFDCPSRTIRKFTDGSGVACFTIIGGADIDPLDPCTGSPDTCVKVYADGVRLCELNAPAFNLDNLGGVGAGDLSLWIDDFACGTDPIRSNFDCLGGVGAGDLSVWIDVFGSGLQALGCPTTKCP
jgi:hypothetical protein